MSKPLISSLYFLLFIRKSSTEYHTHESEDNSKNECCPESIEMKSWNKSRNEENHKDIDHERHEAESEDIEWESEKFEHWSDGTIHEGKDNCHDDRRHISIDCSTRCEIGSDCHCKCR